MKYGTKNAPHQKRFALWCEGYTAVSRGRLSDKHHYLLRRSFQLSSANHISNAASPFVQPRSMVSTLSRYTTPGNFFPVDASNFRTASSFFSEFLMSSILSSSFCSTSVKPIFFIPSSFQNSLVGEIFIKSGTSPLC